GVTGMNGSSINPNAQKLMDTLKGLGATFIPLTIPPDNLPQVSEGFNYEQGAFFDEFVRDGGVERMTSPSRGAGFKAARLMNVVGYLQSQRTGRMMMPNLAKATAGVDVYFSAAPAGQRGGGGRGGRGGDAPDAAAGRGTPPAGGRGGGAGGPGGGPGPTGN